MIQRPYKVLVEAQGPRRRWHCAHVWRSQCASFQACRLLAFRLCDTKHQLSLIEYRMPRTISRLSSTSSRSFGHAAGTDGINIQLHLMADHFSIFQIIWHLSRAHASTTSRVYLPRHPNLSVTCIMHASVYNRVCQGKRCVTIHKTHRMQGSIVIWSSD